MFPVKKHSTSILMLLILVCTLPVCGCTAKEEGLISYSNEKNIPVFVEPSGGPRLITSDTEATDILSKAGVSDAVISAYDASYFSENNLIFFPFITNTEFDHRVDKFILKENLLTLYINEYIPKRGCTQAATYRAILADIPKDSLPEDVILQAARFQQIERKKTTGYN